MKKDFKITLKVKKEVVKNTEPVKGSMQIWKIGDTSLGDILITTITESCTSMIEGDMHLIEDKKGAVIFRGHKHQFYLLRK